MNNKTLVIIPGWGGSHETWASFIELIKPHFKDVVCIDLPCFGGVACPQTVWGVEHYAEYVKRKINKLKDPSRPPLVGEEIVLMGHSFGGQVSAYLVANNPGICEKYIFCAGAVFRPKRPIRRAFFWFVAKFGKILFKIPIIEHVGVWAKKMLYRGAGSPDYSATSGIKRDIFRKIIRQDLTETLPKITTPTLIVWGTLDSYLPVKDATRAHELIADSKLEIIQGGTHGLHLHQSEKLKNLLIKFIYG